MTRFRNALILVGAALGASALLPAVPASADTADKYAHAGFSNGDDHVGMDVDVAKIDGVTTIDVEWHDYQCALTDAAYVCDHVFRTAHDAPVTSFSFSLTGVTRVTADLAYRELRRHCSTVDEQEDCTEEESAGTTTVDVTWTASGEPTRSAWTDEQGVRHVEKRVDAAVTGTGFGLTYGGDQSFGVVHQVRTVDAS